MGSLLYECASHEKLDLLSFWISAFQLQWQINRPGYCFVGAQLALITAMSKMEQNLISSEIIASILQSLKSRLVQLTEYAINPYTIAAHLRAAIVRTFSPKVTVHRREF